MKPNFHAVFFFMACWATLQLAYLLGKHHQMSDALNEAVGAVETRIALDIPKLRLANPTFKTVTHEEALNDYLDQLNSTLDAQSALLRVVGLHGVSDEEPADGDLIIRQLNTSEQSISLTLQRLPVSPLTYLTVLAPLLAGLLVFWGRRQFQSDSNNLDGASHTSPDKPTCQLVVNLHKKTVANSLDNLDVPLSNKPFCFYAAIVDYCIHHDTPCLNQSKNVPDEIVNLANKYFYRLIELGHTKRKKPDFSTNLDKTLSEIRSALDEAFQERHAVKENFYPPKAQGEGSRSKIHNYALEHLQPEQVIFLGK